MSISSKRGPARHAAGELWQWSAFGRLLIPLSLLLCLALPSRSATAQGSLVIIGGGLRPETTEIWQKVVDLAGGRGARIAVFGSASETPQESARAAIISLNAHGAHAFFVPVALKLAGTNAERAARDPLNVRSVRRARGVFFTGGDQGRITMVLRDMQGAPTPVLQAIWRLYRRGGVVAGTSAGAAIMSKRMFFEPRETPEILRSGPIEGQDLGSGLGFLDAGIMVDQHALVRARYLRMLSAMVAAGDTVGLGIDEDTAAVVTPNRPTELIGRSGAVLIHLSDASRVKSVSPLQAEEVCLSLLGAGDLVDLNAGRGYPSIEKLRAVLPRPAFAPVVGPVSNGPDQVAGLLPDALKEGAPQQMAILAATDPAGQSVGVTTEPSGARPIDTAFEVRLVFAPDSRAYFVAGFAPLGGFTITDLHLAIAPLALPSADRATAP